MNTTREAANKMTHKDHTEALQTLLQKNYDAEAGYKKAMEIAESDSITEFLKRRAAQRNEFANEIDQEIRKLNETPIEKGSNKAALHRTWMDVKNFVTDSTDEKVLEECIRGEKAAVEEYKEVLRNQTFRPETTEILSNQMNRIETSLKELRRKEAVEEIMS